MENYAACHFTEPVMCCNIEKNKNYLRQKINMAFVESISKFGPNFSISYFYSLLPSTTYFSAMQCQISVNLLFAKFVEGVFLVLFN